MKIKQDTDFWKKQDVHYKEYWLVQGFSEKESVKKATERIKIRQERQLKFHKDNPGYAG